MVDLLGAPFVDVHLGILLSPGLYSIRVNLLLLKVSNLIDILLTVLNGVASL